MQMTTNAMKAKLKAGQPAFGVSMMFASPPLVEMVGGLGFDWVLIDCEHGAISIESVEALVLAAEASGLTPIARPQTKAPEHILQVLDRGAMGVQVPHVSTRADAEAAVAAVKYHPQGRRGLGGGTRSAAYGLDMSGPDYVTWSNEETLVCIQLETLEGIGNVDEILTVEGVDVFFIGPTDLSQSMGLPAQPGAAPVMKVIDETLAKIVAAGKTPGMPAASEAARCLQDKGVRYIYTHVPKLLQTATVDYFNKAKGG